MGELINGRTAEEIKAAVINCDEHCSCIDCPEDERDYCDQSVVIKYARCLIERLEAERDAALAKVPKWISMKDKLPAEKDATEDGLVLCVLSDMAGLATGERRAWHWENIVDMADCFTHWMPLPEAPKEDAHDD